MKNKHPYEYLPYFCIIERIKAIPLTPNEKTPVIKSWESRKHIPLPLLKKEYPEHNFGFVCGQVSLGLWVIDCDHKDTVKKIEQLLQYYSIETLTVNTKRGKHFYFKSPQIILSLKSENLDIKGEKSYVVAPGSVVKKHIYDSNEKKIYPIFPKGIHKDFIEDLEKIIHKPMSILHGPSKKIKERLTTKFETSTSEQEFNIILELITKRYSKNRIYNILLKSENSFHIHRQKDKIKYFEYSYKKAYSIYKQSQEKEQENKNNIPCIIQEITRLPIKKAGKKILITMYEKANGKKRVKISYRELLKHASIGSLKTIQHNIKDLIDKEYIKKVSISEYQLLYINIPKGGTIHNTGFFRTPSLDIDSFLGKSQQIPLLFSHGYLGANLYFVLLFILSYFPSVPFYVNDLKSFFLFPRSTLYRTVQSLLNHSLIIKVNKSGYILSPNYLDILTSYAQKAGLESLLKKKLEKISTDREAYAIQQSLFIAYKRGHISYDAYKKIPFALFLLGLDYSSMYFLLQQTQRDIV